MQNSAVTKFIASTGFGVTAFQMFFFAVFAFAAELAFDLVSHTYPLVDQDRGIDVTAQPTVEACHLLDEVKKGQAFAILQCTC